MTNNTANTSNTTNDVELNVARFVDGTSKVENAEASMVIAFFEMEASTSSVALEKYWKADNRQPILEAFMENSATFQRLSHASKRDLKPIADNKTRDAAKEEKDRTALQVSAILAMVRRVLTCVTYLRSQTKLQIVEYNSKKKIFEMVLDTNKTRKDGSIVTENQTIKLSSMRQQGEEYAKTKGWIKPKKPADKKPGAAASKSISLPNSVKDSLANATSILGKLDVSETESIAKEVQSALATLILRELAKPTNSTTVTVTELVQMAQDIGLTVDGAKVEAPAPKKAKAA